MIPHLKTQLGTSTIALLAPFAAYADDGNSKHKPAVSAATASTDMTGGEVRKIDREGGKLTVTDIAAAP